MYNIKNSRQSSAQENMIRNTIQKIVDEKPILVKCKKIILKNNEPKINIKNGKKNDKKNDKKIIYKKNNENELLNIDILNENIEILMDNKIENNKILISLSTTPENFLCNEFDDVLDSLCHLQQLIPEYIILNISADKIPLNKLDIVNEYQKKICFLQNKYKNLYVNLCDNYGVYTSLLGFANLKMKFDNEYIVIFVSDSCIMNSKLTFYHNYVYQLYNCDAIGIKNNIDMSDIIFYDLYDDIFYKKNSWSIKYKHINDLINYYKNTQYKCSDNILYFNYICDKNIYTCGINFNFSTHIDNLLNKKKIYPIYEKNIKTDEKTEKYIDFCINKRNLIFNTENIIYDPETNINNKYFNYRHLSVTSVNKNWVLITISALDENIINNESYILNYNKSPYKIILNTPFKKTTYCFKFKNELITHKNYNISIFQTKSKNLCNIYDIYSLSSILTYFPDIKYFFYDDLQCIDYLKMEQNSIYIDNYNKVNPGAYKSDLFRCLKLYNDGGIYIDFKMMLLCNINKYINENSELFCRDYDKIGIYNAFMYTNKKKNNKFFTYLNKILKNIDDECYGINALAPTGPRLLGDVVNKPLCNFKMLSSYTDTNLFGYIELDNKIIIKNVFNHDINASVYKKDNSIHYSIYWDNSLVYSFFNFYLGKNIKLQKNNNGRINTTEHINYQKNDYINEKIYIVVYSNKVIDIIEESLINQLIKPDNYFLINNIDEIKQFNFNNNDKIFFVYNPINEYFPDTIATFLYCYQLYNPCFCWNIGNNNNKTIIFDDYCDFITDGNSFEILFEYKNIEKIFNNTAQLYNCQILKNIYRNKNLTDHNKNDLLLNIQNSRRYEISNKNKRDLIKNIDNIEYFAEDNENFEWFMKVNFLLTYLSENNFLVTVYCTEEFNCSLIEVYFRINGEKKLYEYNFDCNYINKKTFIHNEKIKIIPIIHKNYNYCVFQTAKTIEMSIEKYYSICSILVYLPDINYIFYDDDMALEYLKEKNNKLPDYYNKLIPGAYKSDLFRAMKLYFDNGIYFDCKHILIKPLFKYFFNENQYYCQDCEEGTYNGFMFNNINKNKEFGNYINNILSNIYNNSYGTNAIDITSCLVLNKYFNITKTPNIILLKHTHYEKNAEFAIGFLSDRIKDIKLIQTGYSLKYYMDGTYTNHYNKLWNDKNVYDDEIILDCLKIYKDKCIEFNNNTVNNDMNIISIVSENDHIEINTNTESNNDNITISNGDNFDIINIDPKNETNIPQNNININTLSMLEKYINILVEKKMNELIKK